MEQLPRPKQKHLYLKLTTGCKASKQSHANYSMWQVEETLTTWIDLGVAWRLEATLFFHPSILLQVETIANQTPPPFKKLGYWVGHPSHVRQHTKASECLLWYYDVSHARHSGLRLFITLISEPPGRPHVAIGVPHPLRVVVHEVKGLQVR